MCDRNAKSECILIKLWALVFESICERTTIPYHTMRKYYLIAELLTFNHRRQNICFQYSVAYCSHLSGSYVVLWEPIRCSRDRWCCQLLWAVWSILACSSLIMIQRWMASIIKMSCFINICQSFATCLATSLLFSRTTLLPTEHVRPLTCEMPDFIAPALWPVNSSDLNPVDYQMWGSIATRCITLTSWSHAWSKNGNISTRSSLMKQSDSGVHVFELAFEHTQDILNTDFSYVWYLYRLWQSYVCVVAYSGHFCFGMTALNPLIASIDRLCLNLVICLQLDMHCWSDFVCRSYDTVYRGLLFSWTQCIFRL